MPFPVVPIALAGILLAAGPLVTSEVKTAELDDNRRSVAIDADGFTARLDWETRAVGGETVEAPVLRIIEDDEVALESVGEAPGFDFPLGAVTVGEMDPGSPGPEVVFSSYTGGAHCCTVIRVATKAGTDEWRVIEVGAFDGDGGTPEDVDGDGVLELVALDNDFLYAFDCYACSTAPLVMLGLRDGEIVDISAKPRFRERHRAWLDQMEARHAEFGGEPSRGWWPGWIAAKSRVGEGAEAWSILQQDYRPAEDEGVEVCAVPAEECPDDQWIRIPYPDAVRRFLTEQGYAIE